MTKSTKTPIVKSNSTDIQLPYKFNPRDYQLDLFKAMDNPNYKTFFMRWCRRAGKDKTCLAITAKKMFERVGSYYYIFPQYSQARKAVWEGIDSINNMKFIDHIPIPLRTNVNNNEMKIQMVNGSIIRMIGSDNFDSMRGTNPIGIIYSEYADHNPMAREVMSPILAQNKGWEIIQGTPKGKNHMYDLEFGTESSKGLITNPRAYISVVQTLWQDLPNYYEILTQEQLNEERDKGITEELMEQEYGVSYQAGVQGAYYADQIISARKQGRIGNFPPSDHMYTDTFWDIGLNDDTVIWFAQTDGNAKVFIDYFECNNKSVIEIVDVLRLKNYRYRTHFLPHDGKERAKATKVSYKDTLMDALRQARISDDVICADKPASKIVAINMVRARFSRYLFHEATTTKGLTKLSLYHKHYDAKRRVFIDQPVHDWCSHCADALSTEALTGNYQENTMYRINTPTIITKFDPLDY